MKKKFVSPGIEKDEEVNTSHKRPTLARQAANERTLRKFYNRNYTIAQVRTKTGFNEKTISKYFHKFDEELQNDEKKTFVERELKERRISSLRYEDLIQIEYDMLDDLDEDIKKARSESDPQLGYFLSRKSDAIKTIALLIDKKLGLCILPTAEESMEKIIQEKIEEYEKRQSSN